MNLALVALDDINDIAVFCLGGAVDFGRTFASVLVHITSAVGSLSILVGRNKTCKVIKLDIIFYYIEYIICIANSFTSLFSSIFLTCGVFEDPGVFF